MERRTGGAAPVIRLTGLPAVTRCPHVVVTGHEDRIEIVFSGAGHVVEMDVDHRFLGGADPEAEELRLLARLAEMGYRVTRAPGPVA
ncbi:MAG: hypothetical protein QOD55_1688 [Solirubrobacteraceae bacterium]|nr:hypothetical protein [Solirubrobacteraceae bacterium]